MQLPLCHGRLALAARGAAVPGRTWGPAGQQVAPACSVPGSEGQQQHPGLDWQQQSYGSRDVTLRLGSALVTLCLGTVSSSDGLQCGRENKMKPQGPGLSRGMY